MTSGYPRWISGRVAIAIAAVTVLGVGTSVGVLLGRPAPAPPGHARLDGGPMPGMPGPTAVSPTLQALARETEREDAPTQKLLEFAHLALDQEQFSLAIPAYKRVLARDPRNAEALTHVGLILYRADHVDQALARIDEALRIDPRYAHAHWDRAHILFETKRDVPGAAKSLEAFLKLIPEGPDSDRARALLAEIRTTAATAKP